MRRSGFPPICDKQTEVMFLGSFPSIKSLAEQQYYGHPQNQFWKLLGRLIGEDLYGLHYEQRKRIILKHKIGIWDSYQSCYRKGSLDTNIKKPRFNNFKILKELAPKLKLICFTGQTAGQAARELEELGYRTVILPSPSPANTTKVDEKFRVWSTMITDITS